MIAVDGRLQIDSYEKDGEKKYSSEVVADGMQMLDRGERNADESSASSNAPAFDLV